MGVESYQDPVAKLLTYGDCREMDKTQWDNYPELLGLSEADVPELIRLATDHGFWDMDSNLPEVWAPTHAWRALGQLKAEAAIAPLLNLLELDDDWTIEELPIVYAMIGRASIAPLAAYLFDSSHEPLPRNHAAMALSRIAQAHPDCRNECLAPLMQQLEAFQDNPIEINDTLIFELVELHAIEAVSLLEQVFVSGRVTEFMVGTWASVQIELGLKQTEDFSPDELKPKVPEYLANIRKLLEISEAQAIKPKGFSKPSNGVSNYSSKKKKKKKK